MKLVLTLIKNVKKFVYRVVDNKVDVDDANFIITFIIFQAIKIFQVWKQWEFSEEISNIYIV